jgi:hypothetical protein
MKVPQGVRVNPVTEHLLGHMPERKDVQESLMGAADGMQPLIRLMQLLETKLREYAGEGSCRNAEAVADLSTGIHSGIEMIVPAVLQMALMHEIHAHHPDRYPSYGEQLDSLAPRVAQRYVELERVADAAMEYAAQQHPVEMGKAILEALSRVAKGEL